MLKQIQAKMQDRKGFTLIELMIVIAILGVLAAVAIPYYNQYIKNSKIRVSKSNFDAAVRTIKNEFANRTAGNEGTADILVVLNDGAAGAEKNKCPFNAALPAYETGNPGTNPGQVSLDVTDFTKANFALNTDVTISCDIDADGALAADEEVVLTWE